MDRPTVAGLLVFATEPTEFLASGSIEAACYSRTRLSTDDLIHAERLGGPVSDQIDAGIAFVARFMQASPGKGRSEGTVSTYDLGVVDEAIVNAVAHRDYAIAGAKIRLFLFANRLELYSPGKLPNTITLDDMPYRTFHPQPAPGRLPVEAPQQANGAGIFWSHAAKVCGRSSKTARRTRAAAPSTSCSATNSD